MNLGPGSLETQLHIAIEMYSPFLSIKENGYKKIVWCIMCVAVTAILLQQDLILQDNTT